MKTKLPSTLAHFALAITLSTAALAQTTALTIDPATGHINVPTGPTPFFDVLNVAGTPVPLVATPQQYGAIADGFSHPVNEWLTTGAHSRGYADLAAIQADYPHVASLSDESDWAAGQKVLDMFNVMYLPPGTYQLGNANGGHAWVANADNGQRIIGASRYIDPSVRAPHQGVRVNTAPGTDGIKFAYSSGKVSDVTIWGPSVAMSAMTSGPAHDQQATITTATAHGLRSTPFISGGWTITGNTTGSAPVVTTSAPHGLTSGERIKVTSSEAGITGIFRAIPCDASGNPVANPSPSATHFRLMTEGHLEASAATNGGAGSLVRLYDVYLGPCINDGRQVTGAVPEVLGIYRVLPTDTMTLKVYKWDNTPLILSTDANNNTGVVFTTNRALTFGDDNNITNTINDADSGREFSATDVFVRETAIGIDGQSSDGSGKIDHCFADGVAIAFLAGGNIDKMLVQACWVTSTGLSAYHVNNNGGMTLINSGGANNARLVWLGQELNGTANGGSHLKGVGVYNEGIQRSATAQGADIFTVDCGTNNRATFDDLVITARPADFCDFHVAGPAGFFTLTNSPNSSFICYNQGGQVCADVASNLKVNLYGSTPLAGDYRSYQAGDYFVYRASDSIGTEIPAPSVFNTGRKFLVLPETPIHTPAGFYTTINVTGTPVDVRMGFDVLETSRGGTGLTSYTAGDLIYASATNTLAQLAKGSDGQVLGLSGGLPAWSNAAAQATFLGVTTSAQAIPAAFTDATGLVIPNVPAGTYEVVFEGAAFAHTTGPVGSGWAWQLHATAGTITPASAYDAVRTWLGNSDLAYVQDSISAGESWGGSHWDGLQAHAFRYHGVITLSSTATISVQHKFPDAGTDSTNGQLMGGTTLKLIKQ